ncbi:FG-GAP repeat domain-containing protein [Bradyrhizobium sp. AZCC 1578]|uniref:FG-GAP repeat domain-containing protein n=1 Tax=Bradyrhizobium sp. AZCC 1578 TaxID=3117027 RepID=UPI003FA55A79
MRQLNGVLWTNTGTGNFAVTNNVAGQDGQLGVYSPIVGDFDRDGRADIWWWSPGARNNFPVVIWKSVGGGAFAVNPNGPPTLGPNYSLSTVFWTSMATAGRIRSGTMTQARRSVYG